MATVVLRGLFVAFYAWLALGAFSLVKIVARALA